MKKIAIMLAGLIATTLLVACGSKSNSSDIGNTNSGAGEDVRLLWQDRHVAMASQYSGVLVKNDMLYGYYMNNSGAMVAAQNTQSGDVVCETFVPGATNVQCIAADDQGNIFVLDGDRFWRIDSDSSITSFEDFTLENLESAQNVTPKGIYIDGEGRFYLQYEMGLPLSEFYQDIEDDAYTMADRIYVKDSQLNTLFYEQIPRLMGSGMLSFSFNENGIPMILAKNSDGIYTCEIDIDNQKLTSERQLEIMDIAENSKVTFTASGFIYSRGNDLYQYDYETQTQNKLLSLLTFGILADDIMYLGMNDGIIEIVDNYSESAASEYVAIAEGESQKIAITLGTMQSSKELEQVIASYNRFSQKGNVQIVEYYTGDEYEKSLEQLKLDIISGKGPDMMDVSMMNARIFADKGVFVDLYSFMETDSEFSRDMLLEPIRKTYETQGHLYSMGAAFQLYTMWGADPELQGKNSMSMEELMQFLESRGKTVNAISGFSDDEPVLTTLCTFAMDEFIDWEKGECDFANEYMISLMDFAAKYNGGYSGILRQGIAEGEILLTSGIIQSVADYQIEKVLYGENITFIGYPTTSGTGTALDVRGAELTVNANSSKQDTAWDFIKYYIQKGYVGLGFPTWKENFDLAMQEAMQDDIANSAEGTYAIPKKSVFDGSDGYNYISVYAAGQADVDAVIHIIESAEKHYQYNTDVQNIINEEAESYFSGQKDAYTVVNIIQNRVSLYVEEQRD